ncbi:restriction endonuclease subunit S [Pseudomonas fulva]|uniref:restriction endonuclease subunit S n=1 Tax=Pseudomonas fulva TaxID=47880 RepID=UPI0015E3F857|nr:restriction endonuclease subunit S [Pseudomonas fulva]MBA1222556.1 restriction endonuclease subunit S [Pseudomonas fulva]MBN4167403.1 restriction endonuclease subunit S [Pseudomonas fulva]
MTFQKYPEYKDSDVEWLGEMPGHWIRGSLKNLAWIRNGKDYKDVESSDGEYPVIGSGGMFSKASQYLHDGESVLLGRKGTIDKPLYINGRFWTVDTMFYTEVAKGTSAKFLYYYALTIPFEFYSTSTALPSMTQGDLLNHPAAIPSNFEQTQIARFLDHETARIDALIEEQQRLIELLKEKRQAVISHAVTKGLDPTVPMKDSGVEWLGEVPAHWDVVPTNYRYEIQLGRMLNEQRAQGDHLKPYLRVFDVQWNAINTTDLPLMDFPPEVQSMYRLKSGDLMVNEGGSYVGRSAIWRGDLDECYYQKALHRLRPRDVKSDTAEFFLHVMEMATQQGVFVAGGNQTTIDHLTAEQLRQYRFVFPPLAEQLQIAENITDVVSKIQNTTSEAEQLIGYLKERRSALISAAVTGKIDVRGWQPPASAKTPESAQEAM